MKKNSKKVKKNSKRTKLQFDIITIFPKILDSYLGESLIKRAQESNLIKITAHDLRAYSQDRHKKVDDSPFGGGPGMVLKVDPIYRAVKKIKTKKKSRIILFSVRGQKLNNSLAKRLTKYEQLIMICGRYEGIDERVAEHIADEEISIGDYILSGGELPAIVTIEAISRHLEGFLGKFESLEEANGSHPAYTKPAVFQPKKNQKWKVPEVLISGNHKKISEWRSGKKLSSEE